VIVRNVEAVLNQKVGEEGSADVYIRDRIDWTLRQLQQYAIALKSVRNSGAMDMSEYGNGM
jgi:hypothetical protein